MSDIVVIGGAGDMANVAVEQLLSMRRECGIVLADFNEEKATLVAERLADERVRTAYVDVFDPGLLRSVIDGFDLVMNCTGPYYRTGSPVLEACIDKKVDYIDLGDDDESATALLEMDERAREAGVTALICCGIAPGLVNVIARFLALELDEPDTVELAWVTGSTSPEEGKEKGGAAVIEHMIHCCMGECVTVREGARVRIPSFRSGKELEFPEPLGTYKAFDLGHAETATMPRFLSGVKNVRTMGALHPPYLNGIFRGLAAQVDKGKVGMNEAVDFLLTIDAGEKAKGVRPYLGIIMGVLGQLLHREITPGDFMEFLKVASGRPQAESLGALLVAVSGIKDGERIRLVITESDAQGTGGESVDMDRSTGSCLAVFASMMLDGTLEKDGVFAPEAFVDFKDFYERLRELVPAIGGDTEPLVERL